MANQEPRDILKQGVEVWKRWRKENQDIRADLSHDDLSNANLSIAYLNGTNLSGTNLDEARMISTIFANVNLRTTKGLITIDHMGPSRIELFSVQLPQDGSALHFLRGAGVPDEWIDFWRTTMMHPIQYHSCFLSYSCKDDTLARRLHADLQDHGVLCWFAPEDIKIGDFTRWTDPQAYQRAFARLLRDLKQAGT